MKLYWTKRVTTIALLTTGLCAAASFANAPNAMAAESETAADNAAPVLKPQAGEMQLDGQIMMVREDHSFILDATSFTSPAGKTVEFDEPKTKTIAVPAAALSLRSDDLKKKVAWDEFKAGDHVSVIGKDSGSGTPLKARVVIMRVVAASSVHTLGSEKIGAETARYMRQARAARDANKLDQAINLYNDALMSAGRIHDMRGLAMVNDDLGMLYGDMQQKQKALQAFNDALQIRQTLHDAGGQAGVLNNIGMFHMKNEAYAEAVTALEQSVKLMESSDDMQPLPILLSNLGDAYMAANQNHQALQTYQRLFPLVKGKDDVVEELKTTLIIARLGLSEEKPLLEEAKRYAESAKKRFSEVKDLRQQLLLWIKLVNIYGEMDDKEQAGESLNRAIDIARQLGDKETEGKLMKALEEHGL